MLDYRVILPGVPVSSDRGALGWCSVSLMEIAGKKILFDTGSSGDRKMLLEGLRREGIQPDEIDILFVSHLHFDHFINAELFTGSKIFVSQRDLDYVLQGEFREKNDPYVPFTMVTALEDYLIPCREDDEIVAGLRVVPLPGHTPGTSGLFYEEDRILFASDGVKNGWEFVHNEPPPSFHSETAALENYEFVRRHVDTVIPGHDRPFRIHGTTEIEYVRELSCTIQFYPEPDGDGQCVRFGGGGLTIVR